MNQIRVVAEACGTRDALYNLASGGLLWFSVVLFFSLWDDARISKIDRNQKARSRDEQLWGVLGTQAEGRDCPVLQPRQTA